MIPFFTIFFVVFLILLTVALRKSTNSQKQVEEDFLAREQAANNTRRADISHLDYIIIPPEIFPPEPQTENERRLKELSGEKILNLTGLSNTDLKLAYGVANLDALSEYDSNFTSLVSTLGSYGKELYDTGRLAEARKVLEYAVSIRADAGVVYTTLAELYRSSGEADKIPALIASAGELNSLSKDAILKKLNAMLP